MKKILTTMICGTLLLGAVTPALQVEAQENEGVQSNVETVGDTLVVHELFNLDIAQDIAEHRQEVLAQDLANYFTQDSNGNLSLQADTQTLQQELGMTEAQAHDLLTTAKTFEQGTGVNMRKNMARGFVGLHLNLGPQVRKLNGWAAGTYTAAYIGTYLKIFATTPHTAGVVAVIAGGTAWAVKTAIESRLRRVSVGGNIPFVSLAYTVNIP